MNRPGVRELLTATNRSADSLHSLCGMLTARVPDEDLVYRSICDVEKLEWLFSMPEAPEPFDRFPNETTMVRFVNWVRYDQKPQGHPHKFTRCTP